MTSSSLLKKAVSYSSEIQSLQEITDQYDLFLVDIIGVLGNGIEIFPQAIDCLNSLQVTKQVILLSNMPRPGTLMQAKLQAQGMHSAIDIFTSGDAVRQDLQDKFQDRIVYHLGAERNQDILKDLNTQTTLTLADADIVLLSQFIEQEEAVEQFDDLLQEIAERKIETLCANPDLRAMNGATMRYCAGTFAQRLEDFGGHVEYYGKPNPRVYDLLVKAKNASVSKDRILMIGDTLETDIAGAVQYGIDSLLVMTGNTFQEIQDFNQSIPEFLKQHQSLKNVTPTFYMQSLKW